MPKPPRSHPEHSLFVSRQEELQLLQTHANKSGLLVMLGRRRLGKTSLLKKFIALNNGIISQAIEASKEIQLSLVTEDLSQKIQLAAKPSSWLELLRLLDASGNRFILCLDEFQYLVKSDPSLPSVLQKWLDHENKLGSLVILAGSSTRMIREACLEPNAPLYGRARQVINLAPIDYRYFAEYLALDSKKPKTFALYSLVGGVPKYWEYLAIIKANRKLASLSVLNVIEDMLFASSPFMEGETGRILSDEKIEGIAPLSVLEALGRGATRPSEIASRLGVPQTQLSKIFDQLVRAKVLTKETPFASPERNNKIVNYKITDPSTAAWYTLASTHKSRWGSYDEQQKKAIIDTYVGHIFEQYVRSSRPGAQRYWNSDLEIDLMYVKGKSLYVGEVKWGKLNLQGAKAEALRVREKVRGVGFSGNYEGVFVEIFDQGFLKGGREKYREKVVLGKGTQKER